MKNIWIKKEAGFMVFKNRENDNQYVIEKFNNKDDMLEIEEKFRLLNLDIEYYIGSFNNGAERNDAIDEYKSKKNRIVFEDIQDYGLDREIPCPYPRLFPVTEGMVLKKWIAVKEAGGVYSKYEAWEKGIENPWYYNETMLPEGIERIKKLVLQDKLTTDEDKLFFWSVVY